MLSTRHLMAGSAEMDGGWPARLALTGIWAADDTPHNKAHPTGRT